MLEYILVLTFTVGLILALDQGMGDPLRNYLKSNVLDVIGCMMRSGSFPTESWGRCLGGDVTFSFSSSSSGSSSGNNGNNNGNNNQSDKDSSDSDSGGSSGNDDKSGDSSNGANGAEDGSEDSSGSSGSSSGSGGRGGSNQQELGGSDTTRINLDSDGSSGAAASIEIEKEDQFVDSTTGDSRSDRSNGRSGEQVGGSFLITDDSGNASEDEIDIQENGTTSKKINLRSDDPKVGAFNIPETKSRDFREIKNESSGFSFFGLIKWVLIIGCVLIFIIFIGSQLNTIRKGWTK